MKKLCLILAMILALCGCFAEEAEILNSKPEIPPLIPGSGYQSMPQKIFLPIINFRENELNLPDSAEVFGTRTEIPLVLPENAGEGDSRLVPVTLWPELVAEIQKDYPDFDPENPGWKAFYNPVAMDGSFGILKINYYIDDNIITDKAIIGTAENGVIIRLNYTNVDFEAKEDLIRKKAENFLETTTQTKRIFEEGEEFLSEETMFHYYYPLEKLVYVYQLYFTYGHEGEKVINNDWGYQCFVE